MTAVDGANLSSSNATLTVASGGLLSVTGASAIYTQSAGTTYVDGTLTVGTTTAGSANISGGNIFGNKGTWAANVNNSGGTFNIGDIVQTAGSESISGTYTQSSSGALDIDVGGTTPGTQFDQLTISGAAMLNGTLNLDLINGFIPTIGSMFDILNASTLDNTMFATVNGTSINSNEHFIVVYNSNNVTLDVVAGMGPQGLGGGEPGGNSPTPEPATLLLLATGLLGIGAISRRRSKRLLGL